MRILATFNIESCSIALGENFSSSRRRSTDLGVAEEVGREGGASSVVGFGTSSGTSLTRYILRLPVFKPTISRSPGRY